MSIEDELKRGKITIMERADILKCPFRIFTPEHYREDGTCRCDDETHDEMLDWGYVWHLDRWIAGPDDEV